MKITTKLKPARSVAGRLVIGAGALVLVLGIAGCGSGGGESIDLVAYSTPQQAYEDGIEPAFTDTSEGEGTDFNNSFAASGDQSRAVEAGQPADVVAFSLEPDMTRLVDAGLVASDWNTGEYKGIVTNSVVVLMTRPGNPKDIKSFDDLTRDDVDVINPNPATSGGARWNIMAIYGAAIDQGKTKEEALAQVKDVIANTSVQDASARDSLTTFQNGKGDVLVGYENEAITAQNEGVELEYVVPDSTILIENPAAVTKDASSVAEDFLNFLYTDDAQKVYAENGYRPVVKSVAADNADQFPAPAGLFTIAKFGGWAKVSDPFFGDNGSVIKIEKELGNPTE